MPEPERVQKHYDNISPYYYSLWSEHIHHGYWITGQETKEQATVQLIELLTSKIPKPSTILDIGCGVGGSSRYLQSKYGAKVTGITISGKQVEMAMALTKSKDISFQEMDAHDITLTNSFDLVWAVEMISHLNERANFFKRCASLVNPEGYMVLTDWFESEKPNGRQLKTISNIEDRMIVDMLPATAYLEYLRSAGFEIIYFEDISSKVSKTWDICLGIIKKKEFWTLALKNGAEFVQFLKAFSDVRTGYSSGALRYCAIVAKKL